MNYGEAKSLFTDWLDRDDATTARIGNFLDLGRARVERQLRARFMEKVYSTAVSDGTLNFLTIPTDFLEAKELYVGECELVKASIADVMKRQKMTDTPRIYARMADKIIFGPTAAAGLGVDVLYYGKFDAVVLDTDTNALYDNAPDLAVYAALSFAGDFYQHEKLGDWEGRFNAILQDSNAQNIDEAFSGGTGAVRGAYGEIPSY